jgi:hypothetical protein
MSAMSDEYVLRAGEMSREAIVDGTAETVH